MKQFIAFMVILTAFSMFSFIAASSKPDIEPGYAVVMANGTAIKVTAFNINTEYKTIYMKSYDSGIASTVPLERIKKIVSYKPGVKPDPETCASVYVNKNAITELPDDGGIPVIFQINVRSVSSSGSNFSGGSQSSRGSSRSYGNIGNASSSRSSGSSSMNSSRSFGQSQSKNFGQSSSRSSSTSRSRAQSSSSSSGADAFFNALFGGRK